MAFWQPSKKHLSPIPIKMAFCTPYFEKYSPIVYRSPRLIATGNPKPHPPLKNISHLYEFLWGGWQPFLGGFNYRPHLIGQKDGKIPPLLKTFLTYIHEIAVLYTLFSKIFSLRLHLSSNRTKNNLILPLKRKIFCPSPIRIKTGFWKGVLRNDLHFVYRNRPCK